MQLGQDYFACFLKKEDLPFSFFNLSMSLLSWKSQNSDQSVYGYVRRFDFKIVAKQITNCIKHITIP